jgi:hypothetical protein
MYVSKFGRSTRAPPLKSPIFFVAILILDGQHKLPPPPNFCLVICERPLCKQVRFFINSFLNHCSQFQRIFFKVFFKTTKTGICNFLIVVFMVILKFYDCYIVYIHVSNFVFFVTVLMRSSDGDEIYRIKK